MSTYIDRIDDFAVFGLHCSDFVSKIYHSRVELVKDVCRRIYMADSIGILIYLFHLLESDICCEIVCECENTLNEMYVALLHNALCGRHFDDKMESSNNCFLAYVLYKLKNNNLGINYDKLKQFDGIERELLRVQNGCCSNIEHTICKKDMSLADCYHECTNISRLNMLVGEGVIDAYPICGAIESFTCGDECDDELTAFRNKMMEWINTSFDINNVTN